MSSLNLHKSTCQIALCIINENTTLVKEVCNRAMIYQQAQGRNSEENRVFVEKIMQVKTLH